MSSSAEQRIVFPGPVKTQLLMWFQPYKMPFKLSYSFEGNYRTRPEQNLSGASKKHSRDVLLQRAHEERQKRQVHGFLISFCFKLFWFLGATLEITQHGNFAVLHTFVFGEKEKEKWRTNPVWSNGEWGKSRYFVEELFVLLWCGCW